MGVYWSRDEDERAKTLFRAGMTYDDIAVRMGRSRDSVRRRLDRLSGVNVPKPAADTKARFVAKLHHDGEAIGVTSVEMTRRSYEIMSCRRHLADLVREYGKTVGEAKAAYRSRNELDILPGADFRPVRVTQVMQSYCGSPAANAAGY